MGLDINTNIMAADASRNLATNEMNMQNALEQLSSGYQINKAADNPSGLVISEHLQAQIGGFQQAQANTQSGINVVQTADGALNEVDSILQRIRTLAVQSANTSATDSTAQQAAQAEVTQALSSVANIANTTVFGSTQLLSNSSSVNVQYAFQVGYDGSSSSQVSFSVSALTLANLGLINNTLSMTAADGIASAAGNIASGSHTVVTTAATTASETLDKVTSLTFASAETFTVQASGGSLQTVAITAQTFASTAALVSYINTSLTAGQGVTASLNASNQVVISGTSTTNGSTITTAGANIGALSSSGAMSATTNQATLSLDGQTAVNLTTAQNATGTQVGLTESNGTMVTLTLSGAISSGTLAMTQTYSNPQAVTYSVTAANAISLIDSALSIVDSTRGTFGAYQNELTDISNNESVGLENLQASNAQIQDTNMASTMVQFTQDQILVQAGVSMLSQANSVPQYVLKLLG